MSKNGQDGFTIVEVIITTLIFTIFAYGVIGSYGALRKSYSLARQFNEMYSVLSACPEIDRALQYDALTTGTNCYPNNAFEIEDSSTLGNVTYSPVLNVTNTTDLPNTDPLSTVPDSKVVDISVDYLQSTGFPLKLKLLITRNGVGQL